MLKEALVDCPRDSYCFSPTNKNSNPVGYLLRSFFPSYLSVLGAHQWSWVKGLLCTGRVVKEAPAQVDWEGCKSLVPGPEYQEWYLTLVGGGQTRGPGGKDRKFVRGWN